MGLQYELGISPVTGGFGELTQSLYDEQITPKWGVNLPFGVVKLIQGAFWCKGMPRGIGPGGFDGVFSDSLNNAVLDLKENAGTENNTVVLDAMWAKALFDMSQFVLIPEVGKEKVRDMQQFLNKVYYNYSGILPTDGIYQRATNQAIIFGIQKELGLTPPWHRSKYGCNWIFRRADDSII